MKKRLALSLVSFFLIIAFNCRAQEDSVAIGDASSKWATLGVGHKFDSALHYALLADSIATNKIGELSPKAAITHFMVGFTYQNLNNSAAAYPYFKRSLRAHDASGFSSNSTYLNMLYYFALACIEIGAYTEAESYLSKYSLLSLSVNNVENYLQSELVLGSLYAEIGQYAKAKIVNEASLKVIDSMPQNSLTNYQAFNYNNLAKIYSETGDPAKALVYLKKTKHLFDLPELNTADNFSQRTECIINLADVYVRNYQFDSATELCRQLEADLKDKRTDPLYVQLLAEEATVAEEKRDFKTAIILAKKGLGIEDSLHITNETHDVALVNLATMYRESRQFSQADSIFKFQTKKLRQAGLESSFLFRETSIALCRSLLYQQKNVEAFDSLLALGKTALTAIDKNFAGMTETEQLQFLAGFDAFFDMANTLLTQTHGTKLTGLKDIYTLQLQRKSLVLANQAGLLNSMRNTGDTAAANLFSAWLGTRQMLAKQYSLPSAGRNLNTDSLAEIADGLEMQISAKGLATGFTSNQTVFTRLQQQAANTAAIEFVRFNYITNNIDADSAVYAAFVFKGGDSLPVFVPLCSEKALLKLMRNAYGKPVPEAQLSQNLYQPGGRGTAALYALIWQPLEKYLTGVTAIRYSPAGLLNNISFHAINNTKGCLAGSYTLRRYLNIAAAADADAAVLPKAVSLWGNIVYDAPKGVAAYPNDALAWAPTVIKPTLQSKGISKQPLPAFEADEITPIRQLLAAHNVPVSFYGQYDATEENFKAAAQAVNGVLHISTHGFYTPLDKKNKPGGAPAGFIAGNANPLFRCGLAFAGVNYYWMKGVPQPNREDGILTGYEAAQLDLHNVQLVTLSACETGLGDVTANEGNFGMQRAFKLAGAKNLLVSLWQVPAKATQQMLTKFYAYWLQGNSLSKALQLAEADTRKIHPEPFYWAGFVLVE